MIQRRWKFKLAFLCNTTNCATLPTVTNRSIHWIYHISFDTKRNDANRCTIRLTKFKVNEIRGKTPASTNIIYLISHYIRRERRMFFDQSRVIWLENEIYRLIHSHFHAINFKGLWSSTTKAAHFQRQSLFIIWQICISSAFQNDVRNFNQWIFQTEEGRRNRFDVDEQQQNEKQIFCTERWKTTLLWWFIMSLEMNVKLK